MNSVKFATVGSHFYNYNTYYLEPLFDARKSFYKKAEVRKDNGNYCLLSYGTPVVLIIDGQAYVDSTYSQTTLRHIKEFLKQQGFQAETKSQILNDYGFKD